MMKPSINTGQGIPTEAPIRPTFIKDNSGNYYNRHTKYYLGTDPVMVAHLIAEWGISKYLDSLMEHVNESISSR